MAVEPDEVRELLDFAPEGFLVTSFYLNVDAGEFPAPQHIEKTLDSLLHSAQQQREETQRGLSHQASESLRADLDKIDHFVKEDFRRVDTNGLAIFSCSARDFWDVVQLPNAVESRVVFGPRPYVAPLATFLSDSKPTAILLTDRKRARIITMRRGQVKQWTDLEDRMIERSKAGGWSQMRYQRHADAWAKHHVDHAAELVLRLEQHYPFDWLILGVEVEVEADLMKDLHPYVKDRVVGTIHVRIDAPVAEVVERAKAVRDQAEARLIDNLMRQIEKYAGAGGRATVGLATTLDALNQQRVYILLVQEGYTESGFECPNCGLLIAEQAGPPPVACPACSEPVRRVENIVGSAIQRAFELGSNVEVETERNKLEPIGYIGSITYY
jgi:peptide chain release factor subunit 1